MTIVQYREPDEGPRARAWIELMGPAVELAKAVAGTGFVPKAMRGNAAEITAAILYGDELGIGPMQSLAKISVIEGKPTLAAETQRALILAAGHRIWREENTLTRVTWAGKRSDEDITDRVTWTMDDARRAGIANKPSWRAYPRAMLSARASAELARAIFADVIGGLAATEELEDAADLDRGPGEPGAVATVAEVQPPSTMRRRRRQKVGTALATTSGAVPTETVELPPLPGEEDAGPPAISDKQRGLLFALLREQGITTQAQRHRYASRVLNRPVTTSAGLNADEAALLIGALEAERDNPRTPEPGEEPEGTAEADPELEATEQLPLDPEEGA